MIVDITVDGKTIQVDDKNNLIDELKKHNIEIPHFCYHKSLGVDGNCRMCLIELQGSKRPQIACDTPIKAGMDIITKSDSIKKLRQSILELELINHPLDCGVCDQVGECYLQEYYMKYDLQQSRIEKKDKLKKNKVVNFGNGIMHDEERCVLCTRCVRFTTNITKTNELGVVGRGDHSHIAVFPNSIIHNRYSQNIVDVCPVGAMTSIDFRFKKRVYFLKSTPSICHACAKGCNIYIDHHKAKNNQDVVYRYRPRYNKDINKDFLCDDGRYSYKDIHYTSTDINLRQYIQNSLILISPNSTIEEMYILNQLAIKYNIPISGYSDSYISDDCDDFLIQKDKSANRKSLQILNINTTKEYLQDNLKDVDYVLAFDTSEDILSMLSNQELIKITTKHFSQKDGTIINIDGIIQEYKSNIISDGLSLLELLSNNFDTTKNRKEILKDIKSNISYFENIDLSHFAYDRWGK